MSTSDVYIRWLEETNMEDIGQVGGKNAALGAMIRELKDQGVQVPDGFATTAEVYWQVIKFNGLDQVFAELLDDLDKGQKTLPEVGRAIRNRILQFTWPEEIASAITDAYRQLGARYDTEAVDVAVRSSATAEDLPDASFAGQQETFLNVSGENQLLEAIRKCFASLFTDRAISYRQEKNFDHLRVALSAGVQKMVRSDLAGSGVMFSIDTETGFPDTVIVSAAWGLGENVVQGTVTPDEYRVFKPLLGDEGYKPIVEKNMGAKERKLVYAHGGTKSTKNVLTAVEEKQTFVLSDAEILQLARWAKAIEDHYGRPMDMEWAKDGNSGQMFMVQARPETVQSRRGAANLQHYTLKERGEPIIFGLSIGDAIASGKVCRIKSADDIQSFESGSILVTEMTDPDWVPIMKKAVGIVTDHGGRTCHAAIVSREMGIPAIVGTGSGTQVLGHGDEITMSCAEGEEGVVYKGILDYEVSEVSLDEIPKTSTQIMMNIASPTAAYRWWRLPCHGIGLARMEFIINNVIKIHPMALLRFDQLQDRQARANIQILTHRYTDKAEYFVDNLAMGIAKIAASQYPYPVIVRMSDFKTNEYANLIGGQAFEPHENNPMIGFRGASRYYSEEYREGFALECRAIKRVREEIGLSNVVVMIPFCRTLAEADKVLQVMAENGLTRGENGLEVYVMCEIPSNIVLAEEFAQRFDGFSIGSNDLTQLILGVDRDSGQLRHLFNEQDEAVKRSISTLLQTVKAKAPQCKVGICGQAPSDYPEFAAFLVREGIDSISLNPDSLLQVMRKVAEMEDEIARLDS
ncbi:MAG: phosphoenolpyruvate synthase [Desulfovermiculus sp.]|nr:phosphoenolpyruvate synthase [Desulfovermiculus sp.]